MTLAMAAKPAFRQNVELKAKLHDLNQARALAQQLGARHSATLHQCDTYFRVSRGQLKLRETQNESAVLIWYERPAHKFARVSTYYLTPIPEPTPLKESLRLALGVRGQIIKTRELWLYENVRIHLDQIKDIGSLLEFEAVLSDVDDHDHGQSQIQLLRDYFGIEETDLIAESNEAHLAP